MSGNAEGGAPADPAERREDHCKEASHGWIRQDCRAVGGAGEKKVSVMRGLVVLLACVLLTACAAHGPGKKFDPGAYVNDKPGSEAFYRELMTGRVWLFEQETGAFRNVVHGLIYASDGRVIECFPGRFEYKLYWNWRERKRWSVSGRWSGVSTRWDIAGEGKRFSSQFYDPETLARISHRV